MPEFLSTHAALAIHHDQVAVFGNSQGVRDQGLLESALGAARQTDAYTGDVHQTAAQYLVSIARNRPFADGNKRTGAACMLVFMDLNDIPMNLAYVRLFELTLEAATGKLARKDIADEIR